MNEDFNENKSRGWVYLFKSLLEWEWYDDANTFRLFIHCLLLANWKNKKWRGILIKRGSFITSQQRLADDLGLSVRQVRLSLDKLKMSGELTVKTTNIYTVITVQNYDRYQRNVRQPVKRMSNGCKTDVKRMSTTNKYNKGNKDNKEKRGENTHPKTSDITDTDLQHIANKYKVPLSFVKSKLDDIELWAPQQPPSKLKNRNWKLTLMRWVKDDALKIQQEHNEKQTRQNKYGVTRIQKD